MPPPILTLADEAAFRAHFHLQCCAGPIVTHDNYIVHIRRQHFDHCCYKTDRRTRKKNGFCNLRAARIDWIPHALRDATLPMHVGWDSQAKAHDHSRRVTVVQPDFAVIIEIIDRVALRADFITAFIADADVIAAMLTNPVWA